MTRSELVWVASSVMARSTTKQCAIKKRRRALIVDA